MSFTSRHTGSSCCPWRGRGWNHLTGMAHGAGGGFALWGVSSSPQSGADPGSPGVSWLWWGLFSRGIVSIPSCEGRWGHGASQ